MERCVTGEGVRASNWWLLDERGGEHLAVIGAYLNLFACNPYHFLLLTNW